MRFSHALLTCFLASGAWAASAWSFDEGTLTVQTKGAGVGAAVKEKLKPSFRVSKPVSLGSSDSLKVFLTTTEGNKPKRPHQAFLTLSDPVTGVEESFIFNVKENGKGKVELTHKDLPTQFLLASKPIPASIVIGSFGSSTPYKSKAFDLTIARDPSVPLAAPEAPERYAAAKEIHHIFRTDPKAPPKIITLVFTAAVIAAFPVLLGAWVVLGANVDHLGKALGSAPLSHALFYGSVLAMEGIFFMYYTSWNLFQTLPAAAVVGSVAFLSGSRALSEVQQRRLDGTR